jgi:hypothetical protein
LSLGLLGCKTKGGTSSDLAPALGAAIPCTSRRDCPKELPMCHPDSAICVGCIESFQTCGAGLTCDPSTHSCIPADPMAPCRRNPDCPRMGFDPATSISCDVDAGVCYECTTSLDCVDPDVCVRRLHICGDACMECLPGQICDRANRRCLDGDGGAPHD